MKEKKEDSSLLKPYHFAKNDANNPKNMDVEKKLEEARKKRLEVLIKKSSFVKDEEKK